MYKRINLGGRTMQENLFSVGDWIVSEYGNVLQVVDLQKYGYYCKSPIGYGTLVYYSEQDLYHLWTLSDAKEGDVIVSYIGKKVSDEAWMCIFKNVESLDEMSVHCYKPFDTDDVCIPEDDDTFTTTRLEPASFKDVQRFMKLLQNRGYYFDKDEMKIKQMGFSWIETEENDRFTLASFQPFDKVLVRHHLHRKDGISLV